MASLGEIQAIVRQMDGTFTIPESRGAMTVEVTGNNVRVIDASGKTLQNLSGPQARQTLAEIVDRLRLTPKKLEAAKVIPASAAKRVKGLAPTARKRLDPQFEAQVSQPRRAPVGKEIFSKAAGEVDNAVRTADRARTIERSQTALARAEGTFPPISVEEQAALDVLEKRRSRLQGEIIERRRLAGRESIPGEMLDELRDINREIEALGPGEQTGKYVQASGVTKQGVPGKQLPLTPTVAPIRGAETKSGAILNLAEEEMRLQREVAKGERAVAAERPRRAIPLEEQRLTGRLQGQLETKIDRLKSAINREGAKLKKAGARNKASIKRRIVNLQQQIDSATELLRQTSTPADAFTQVSVEAGGTPRISGSAKFAGGMKRDVSEFRPPVGEPAQPTRRVTSARGAPTPQDIAGIKRRFPNDPVRQRAALEEMVARFAEVGEKAAARTPSRGVAETAASTLARNKARLAATTEAMDVALGVGDATEREMAAMQRRMEQIRTEIRNPATKSLDALNELRGELNQLEDEFGRKFGRSSAARTRLGTMSKRARGGGSFNEMPAILEEFIFRNKLGAREQIESASGPRGVLSAGEAERARVRDLLERKVKPRKPSGGNLERMLAQVRFDRPRPPATPEEIQAAREFLLRRFMQRSSTGKARPKGTPANVQLGDIKARLFTGEGPMAAQGEETARLLSRLDRRVRVGGRYPDTIMSSPKLIEAMAAGMPKSAEDKNLLKKLFKAFSREEGMLAQGMREPGQRTAEAFGRRIRGLGPSTARGEAAAARMLEVLKKRGLSGKYGAIVPLLILSLLGVGGAAMASSGGRSRAA